MHSGLHLAAIRGVAALGLRIIGGQHLDHLAVVVSDHLSGGDEVGATQPHLASDREPVELRWRRHGEVVLLDVQLAAERHPTQAVVGILGVVHHLEVLDLPGRPIGDRQPQRSQHRHPALRGLVELAAHIALQLLQRLPGVGLRNPHVTAERDDRRGRVAAPTQPTEGGHPRVVPAIDDAVVDQPGQAPLGGDGVVEFEAGELDLPGLFVGQR